LLSTKCYGNGAGDESSVACKKRGKWGWWRCTAV
jgi:hypothetical protein